MTHALAPALTIDWTINAGHILTAIVLLFGASGVIYALRGDVKAIKSELGPIKTDLKQLVNVLVQIGKQDQQLKDHDRRITKLEDN